MSAPRFLRSCRPAALGLVVALAALAVLGGASASPLGRSDLLPNAVSGNGPCPSPGVPTEISGTVTVEGGPLPSTSNDGVAVSASYSVQVEVRYVSNDSLAEENCTPEQESTVTNASGGFALALTLPPNTCSAGPNGEECTSYTGPFGRLAVATESVPAGYGLSVSESGSSFDLVWVADLAFLSMTPSSPLAAIAGGGSLAYVASPEMANGSASPLTPTYSWSLSGPGYRFSSSPAGGSVTVVAPAGWSNGTLTVNATASVDSEPFVAPNVTVGLATVPTTVTGGGVNRTTVDAGGTVALSANATGAEGYAYSLSVASGLSPESYATGCTTTPVSSSEVDVRCATDLLFPDPGNGTVSAAVSNGPSSAAWVSSLLTVAPPPAVSLVPSTPVGYAGRPLPVEVRAAAGVAPYVDACFDPGFGAPLCRSGSGAIFSFAPTYPAVGNYTARAWLVDATGTNRSLSAEVRVVAPLAVGPLSVGGALLSAGVSVALSATVAGGAFPAEAWWNASDEAGPIATVPVTGDGALAVEFQPPAAGPAQLTLTVVDVLGSVAEANLTVPVGPGPVATVAPVPPDSGASALVGRPVSLEWRAFDAFGEAVPTFSAPVDLVVQSASGQAALSWVNLSTLGALSSSPEGSFAIPASAWADGVLPVTFTPAESGSLTVALEGSALPGGAASVSVSAEPDLDHLRLYDPVVQRPGGDTNRTFWHVSDRFGDPVPGAFVTVQFALSGGESVTVLPVGWYGGGGTGVWLNYSLPAGTVGIVRILDLAGDVLYGPVRLPSFPSPSVPVVPLTAASGSGGLAAAVAGISVPYLARRRAKRARPRSDEEELRRFAEGRAVATEVVRSLGPADALAIRAAWVGETPAAAEFEEWLASLVADGTLTETTGRTGTVEYVLPPEVPDGPPRVVVDADALERAVARRDAAVREEEPAAR